MKNQNFAKNVLNIKIPPGFCLYRRKMIILTFIGMFKLHSMQIYLKMAPSNVKKNEKGFNQPLQPLTLTAYSSPGLVVTLIVFFHQMTTKGCKRDYLYAPGHFPQDFKATGKTARGVATTPPPLARRGLIINGVLGWDWFILGLFR